MKKKLILTGNCYWCTESIFMLIEGCSHVTPGYITFKNESNYSGKVEAVSIDYDSSVISLEGIMDIYYQTHNPTLVKWNKEDCEYPLNRSGIVYYEKLDSLIIGHKLKSLQKAYNTPLRIKLFKNNQIEFKETITEEKEYYFKNPESSYSKDIIKPKLYKLFNSPLEKYVRKSEN